MSPARKGFPNGPKGDLPYGLKEAASGPNGSIGDPIGDPIGNPGGNDRLLPPAELA